MQSILPKKITSIKCTTRYENEPHSTKIASRFTTLFSLLLFIPHDKQRIKVQVVRFPFSAGFAARNLTSQFVIYKKVGKRTHRSSPSYLHSVYITIFLYFKTQ